MADWRDMERLLMEAPQRPRAKDKDKVMHYREISVISFVCSWKGTVFRGTWMETLAVVLIALALTLINFSVGWEFSLEGHKLTIIPIGFLLVIRTNLAYNRYWEGRTLIASLTFHARELSSKCRAFISGSEALLTSAIDPTGKAVKVVAVGERRRPLEEVRQHRHAILRMACAFLILMRHNLSGVGNLDELVDLLSPEELSYVADHGEQRPLIVVAWLRDAIAAAEQQRHYNTQYSLRSLDKDVSGLLRAWMGMAKITTTPFPFPYAHMLRVFLYLWVFTLPIPMVPLMGWNSPIVVAFVAFSLFGINSVGEELENPFGEDANDFDLVSFENAILHDMSSVKEAI
eukprot:TRINITY_DN6165_c0_g1_i1.p1 TRINITY_DN6165_c0_g1~~TRINITY_DN6165_c0_g1_i1.p1  ORF type:complete len:345 (-),score=51.37 TRINITY_DN6165_c0_g1_i1:72-1106(-)